MFAAMLTSEVEEVGVLAKYVEDSRSSIGHLRGRQDSDGMFREFICESRTAMGILERGDSRRY